MPLESWYPKRIKRQATEWTGTFTDLPAEWRRLGVLEAAKDSGLLVTTVHGRVRAEVGDYIARDVAGTFYPVKRAIWLASYEKEQQP